MEPDPGHRHSRLVLEHVLPLKEVGRVEGEVLKLYIPPGELFFENGVGREVDIREPDLL